MLRRMWKRRTEIKAKNTIILRVSDCIQGLTADSLFDCENRPIGGIEQAILLINWDDIDRVSTRFNEKKTRITRLYLKDHRRAYLFKGYKRILGGSTQANVNKALNGHRHSVNVRFYAMNDESLDQVNKVVNRGSFVAIVETIDKRNNGENAFEILGYDCGLTVASGKRDYDANDASYLMEFSTPKNMQEPRALYKWLEQDYANTLVRFNNKLQSNSEDDFKIFDRTFDYTFE